MSSTLRLAAIALLLAASSAIAQDYVPDQLQGWQQWVLKDKAYRDCPFYFDRGAAGRGDFLCAWPGQLQITVSERGGRFTQQWTVHADDQWIALPGNAEHWPDQVTANDKIVPVIARNGVPSVRLEPGAWRLAGRFEWDKRPGVLPVPPESGLLALTVDGRAIERPALDRSGVFLGERRQDTRSVDSVRPVIYRLVTDDVPTRLVTHLQIDVSGSVREEVFGPLLPEGFVPLNLQSQLPAKLEADGRLHLQVRPGRWVVYISARAPGVNDAIASNDGGTNMPDAEIWSYQSNDRLRVTAAEGLPPVDPAQVEVPGNWQSFPAFRVAPAAVFAVTERSRGIVSARNELTLRRTMWLDFDGDGFIVEDDIQGEMRTGWRLDMGPPWSLLAAREYEENLLITKGAEAGQTGVEVRQTYVGLDALGRSETRGAMSVTGWNERFARVTATLHLPPGHKLLAAPGVDVARGSWVGEWQLLDFFLVLIITIAVWRLFSPTAGVIALLALVLSFHELFAPTWVWLNLLAAIALLRVAPDGRLRTIVRSYQLLSAAVLLIALVPFVAGQVRTAIYPQLEPQYNAYGLSGYADEQAFAEAQPASRRTLQTESAVMDMAVSRPAEKAAVEEVVVTGSRQGQNFSRYAPNAIVQAGQGIPSWRWNTHSLSWSGPVDPSQSMRLIVLPRWLVSILRLIEVGLMLLFAAIIAAEITNRRWTLPGGVAIGRVTTAVTTLAIGCSLMLASAPSVAQMPDKELLQQLEQRLLEPPDCVPRCAEIAAADVAIRGNAVSMRFDIHALEDVALPLPGSAAGWRPSAVLLNSASDVRVLRAPDGTFWLNVAPGRHTVTLRGSAPEVDSLEIPFPTPPRVIRVDSDGWLVAGLKDRRLLSGSLQLTRQRTDEGGDEVRWESSRFPAFARVERTIELDLDWRVRTTVYRIAPMQGALTLEIPLVDGETIVSGDFAVSDGQVLVSMSPQQRAVTWTSNLPLKSPLTLRAPAGSPWKELWRVAAGNIWNAHFDGLPESNTGSDISDVRIAEFDPRAGEALVITANRPAASSGSTLAFDSVHLTVAQGGHGSDATLELRYRSTRGAQHVVQLPAGADVTSVAIDGRELTVRAEDGELTLPILPGEHAATVAWRSGGAMGFRTVTPEIDLGAPASNIELQMTQLQDRWLLATSGPQLGPAVLYWSELAVLVLFAVILGRIGLAPLTTRHWLFLGLGFSTFSWPVLAVVVVWLLACAAREKFDAAALSWTRFNFVQFGIGGLTVIALLSIVSALPQGLLGTPDMHVSGHNSTGAALGWFADHSDSLLPVASAFSVPMWTYKVLILVWALWLSFALVRWLPWVWKCFSKDGLWRSRKDDSA